MDRVSNVCNTLAVGNEVGELVGAALSVTTFSGGLRSTAATGDGVGCSVSVSFPAEPPSVAFANEIWVGLVVGPDGTVEFVAAAIGAAVGGVLVTEISGMDVGSKVGGEVATTLTEGIFVGEGGPGEGGVGEGGVGGLGVGLPLLSWPSASWFC